MPEPPSFLLNAGSITHGGGLQAAVAFIQEAARDKNVTWTFVVTKELIDSLGMETISIIRPSINVIHATTARSYRARRWLASLIETTSPDAVLTLFGPAYVAIKHPHVLGVADGWVTHSDRLAYSKLSGLLPKFQMYAMCIYKRYWFKKADSWIVEADCALLGLVKRWQVPSERITVIPNTCSSFYSANSTITKSQNQASSGKKRIVTLSSYYPHKNLEIIPEVAKILHKRYGHTDIDFCLSLEPHSSQYLKIKMAAERLGVAEFISTTGTVPVELGPKFYEGASLMFLPTVLETFSANYPEAMSMRIPIITSRLPFAEDICGESAVYFDPESAQDAARKIHETIGNERLRTRLIEAGVKRLASFPNTSERYQRYVKTLRVASTSPAN